MSAPAFAWAFEKGHELGLTSNQLVLLLYMADQANGAGTFFTGQPRMAKYTRLCIRTIRDLVPQLTKLGLIQAHREPGKPTEYRVMRQPVGEAAVAAPAVAARQANGAATPAAAAGLNGGHPGNSRHQPRQMSASTPAAAAPDPLFTQVSTQDARARAKAEDLNSENERDAATTVPAPPKAPVLGATNGSEPPANAIRPFAEQSDDAVGPKAAGALIHALGRSVRHFAILHGERNRQDDLNALAEPYDPGPAPEWCYDRGHAARASAITHSDETDDPALIAQQRHDALAALGYTTDQQGRPILARFPHAVAG